MLVVEGIEIKIQSILEIRSIKIYPSHKWSNLGHKGIEGYIWACDCVQTFSPHEGALT